MLQIRCKGWSANVTKASSPIPCPLIMSLLRGTCLVWMLACFLLSACHPSEPSLPFDSHLRGLKLVKLISGGPAVEAINQLHGMPIDIVRGFVAYYQGNGGDKATLWVSEASSEELAEKQIEVMIHKMKQSRRSPFRDYHVLDVKGVRVVAFDGMGQVHRVFREKRWVYWISADAGRIDGIVAHIRGTG
jgi:hypothetical protein